MRHFPIFIDLTGQPVVLSGAGEVAVPKIRLLMKTGARITVFGEKPHEQIRAWADESELTLVERRVSEADVAGARLLYGANGSRAADKAVARIGKAAGVLTNIVDNLGDSEFITPAIVDRDPVTIAIGTEGTAPMLARKIKADLEEMLPAGLGALAKIANRFRPIANILPTGEQRRTFWHRFFFGDGVRAHGQSGAAGIKTRLSSLLAEILADEQPSQPVAFVGAGPGDPDLLTVKARRLLSQADVILHDRLVPQPILELARREATIISVGKKGYGPAWKQADINRLLVEHGRESGLVVRLKSGDPTVFGRLDEELEALEAAGIAFEVVPGITAATAAAAGIGASLTRRGRNSDLRVLTGRATEGFAEHEWRELASQGATAAIYMGVHAARFIQGRLLMHGADRRTPVTVVENASRSDERIIATTLGDLPVAIDAAAIDGPAVLLLGLEPRQAARAMEEIDIEGIAQVEVS